ncbi:MAG: ATP-binding protein [Oleiphilaceae bacterium]|nr:ATP-binding protein [Oleiphilaceae bacterium]
MISLDQRLRRLVMSLVLGISLLVVSIIAAVYVIQSEHQRHEEALAEQLLLLIDTQQRVAQANSLIETWSHAPSADKRLRIVGLWSQNWDRFKELWPEYRAALRPSLVRLEVGHWRLMDIQRQGLHRSELSVFNTTITPQIDTLFALNTRLVNQTLREGNSRNLGHAADIRGYYTRAMQALSAVVRTRNDAGWGDYFAAMLRASESVDALQQSEDLSSAVSSMLFQLNDVLGRIKSNAHVLKRLTETFDYYDTERIILSNQHITLNNEREMGRLFNAIRIARDELLARTQRNFVWTVTGVLAALLVLLMSLMIWRRRLHVAIVSPIKAIVDNSHRIASAQQTDVTLPDTGVEEMRELTNAVELIRQIVKADQLRVASERTLHEGVAELNAHLLKNKELESFCQRALETVVARVHASGGALFVRTQPSVHQEPVLCAQVNISAEQERHYRQSFDGLPRHCYASQQAYEGEVKSADVRINSAFTEQGAAFQCLLPLFIGQEVIGVAEFFFRDRRDYSATLVKELVAKLGALLQASLSNDHMRVLLVQTQKQKQQLDDTMTELRAQTQALQQSEAELEMQTDELKIANLELRRQAETTEKQKIELQKLNSSLQRATRELQESSNQKSAFLSKVSHELRTPLNSIMVLTQVLLKQDNSLTEEQKQSLSVIRQSGEDLLTLINDLLDLARVEAGKMKFHFETLRVRDLTERLNGQFKVIAQQKGVEWEVNVAENVPETFVSDPQRLSQVLRNFLSNAFKFTAKGGVSLHVGLQGEMLVFEVEDSGVGIAKADQGVIFDSFVQVDSPVTANQTGSGLGLSIARQIAECLGGHITLVSESGKGSCFSLFVPLYHSGEEVAHPLLPVAGVSSAPEIDSLVQSAELLGRESASIAVSSSATEQTNAQPQVKPRWALVGDFAYLEDEHRTWLQARAELVEQGESFLQQPGGAFAGVLLDGDIPLVSDGSHDIHQRLQKLSQRCWIVVLVSNALHNDNAWLEGVAHHMLRWNTAGQERLAVLLQKQKRVVSAAESDAAQTPLLDASIPSETTHSPYAGLSLLLLDDDMRGLFSMGMALRQAGFNTELADTVAMAKGKLASHTTDLILTDLILPGEDGIQFIDFLKQHAAYRNIPVIVLSAKDSQEDRERCMNAGAADYIPKPVAIPELLHAIDTIFKAKAETKNAADDDADSLENKANEDSASADAERSNTDGSLNTAEQDENTAGDSKEQDHDGTP